MPPLSVSKKRTTKAGAELSSKRKAFGERELMTRRFERTVSVLGDLHACRVLAYTLVTGLLGGVAYRLFCSQAFHGLGQLRINLVGNGHHVKQNKAEIHACQVVL
jgi:hypothetical protein